MAQLDPSDDRPWADGLGFVPHVRGQGDPASGPLPRLVLGDEQAIDIIKRIQSFKKTEERQRQFERFMVLIEQHVGLVQRRIDRIHTDETIKAEIRKHADASINLARDITNDVCSVWKQGARRTIEGASEAQIQAFLRLVEDSKFEVISPAWNRQAFYLGPVTVVPVVRRDRMTWDTLLPHAYFVEPDPEDQWGPPLAAAWEVWQSEPLSAQARERPAADAIVLDSLNWKYINMAGGAGSEVRSEPHGLDVFPGAVLRFDDFRWGDWWGIEPNRRLQDATLQLGFLMAMLSYVRKTQNRKIMTATGDIRGIPKGQVANAEVPLEADTKSPEQINIDAIDLDTDPEHFIKHITWLMNVVARSYGGVVTLGASSGALGLIGNDISFSHDVLTEIRNAQIPHAREFERDLWSKAVGIAKENGHPLSDDLPPPDLVQMGFRVEYPRLARTFSSIDEEIQFWTFALKNGRASYGDLLRSDMPGATDEELDDEVLRRVERQVPIVEAITKRNLSLDPSARADADLTTPSQQFGAQGPEVRDSTEETDNTESE